MMFAFLTCPTTGDDEEDDDSGHMVAISAVALVRSCFGRNTCTILRGVASLAVTVAVECDLRPWMGQAETL